MKLRDMKKDLDIFLRRLFEVNDLISIVVPVYNVEEYIVECIESVLQQTYKNWELLLIDDGSTDDSGEICENYSQRDERIRVFHKQNGGQSTARNYGLDRIKGKYLIFLDSDDYWNKNALSELYAMVQKYDSKIVCMGNRLYNDAQRKFCGEAYVYSEPFVLSGEEAFSNMLIRNGLDSNPWGKLYESELWQDIRFPEGHIFEDIPVTYRILLKAPSVVNLGKPYCVYRIRSTSTTGENFSKKRIDYTKFSKDVYEFVKKYYPQYSKNGQIFYLNAVVENYLRLGRVRDKRDYLEYSDFIKKEIKKYFWNIIESNYFSSRMKFDIILNIIGVYRLVRKIL